MGAELAQPPGLTRVPSAAQRFLLVAVLVLATRLAFLGPGYGVDPDAWRVAWSAHVLATTGHYEASRFPGYPIQELISSWLLKGGPLALNGMSALLSAIGAGCFALTVRRLGGRDDVAAALALASTPAVFLSSVTAMDYAWALGFGLAALDMALRGRAVLAGVLAGLAIGSRITSLGFLPPLAIALASVVPPAERRRAVARFGATALAIGALAFLPVLLAHGPGFLRFYQHGYPRALYVLKNASVDLWGIPGVVAIAMAVALWMLRRPHSPAAPGKPGLATAWASGIAIFGLAYLRLPIKAFYLVSAVPFVLLLLARTLSRRAFLTVCLALVVSPWALKVSQPGKPDSLAPTAGTIPLEFAGQSWTLDLLRGPILADHERRALNLAYVERSLARARALAGESVIVAYDWLPQIRVRLSGKREGRVEYVYLLTAAELAELQRRGVSVYDMAGAEGENLKVNGVSLRANGARSLDALDEPGGGS